jgi:hypothetical protein
MGFLDPIKGHGVVSKSERREKRIRGLLRHKPLNITLPGQREKEKGARSFERTP